jgi:hypothetical protein
VTPGIVYFLVNRAMPGLVKIGRTTGTVEQRVQQLSSTGIPQPFQAVATFHVYDSETCEKAIHLALSAYRPNKNREFFEGHISDLVQQAIPVISTFLRPAENGAIKIPAAPVLDEEDIYFMQFILHDGYEQGAYLSTEELVQHHNKYAPLELEYKLLKLADLGMIERSARTGAGLSAWGITPSGVKFMFESGNVLHDLIIEARPRIPKTSSTDTSVSASFQQDQADIYQ